MHSLAIQERTRIALILLAGLSLATRLLSAETPAPETLKAFDSYLTAAETRNNEELAARKNFLWLDILPQSECKRTYRLLKHQQTIIHHSASCVSRDCSNVPGGMIHDWTGITFVPGVTLRQTLTAIQDYDRDADYYRPTVLRAKFVSREGNSFRVFLRLKETHVITVVLDTEYEIQYLVIDSTHAASVSRSTRITEVEGAGSQEHATSPKANHGFLWRLNSYWRFYQADGGVYIDSRRPRRPRMVDWTVHRKCPPRILGFHTDSNTRSTAKEIPKQNGQIAGERKNHERLTNHAYISNAERQQLHPSRKVPLSPAKV